MTTETVQVRLRRPHAKQAAIINSTSKRQMVKAGRRSGKTTIMAEYAVDRFLKRHRVLYAVPTADQLDRFWFEVKRALSAMIDAGILYCNETRHIVEFPSTETRIRAKSAYNADTLRGDYADELILDEWQLMNEDAWAVVGAPMLLDNDGNAIFVYTPPSLHSRSASKARDKLHASKLYKRAQQDPRWETHSFTSHDNPYISRDALEEITGDMTALAYRMEIMAEDIDEVPGALWSRACIDDNRVWEYPDLVRIVVSIDPAVTSTEQSDETGLVVGGISAGGHGYVLEDISGRYTPDGWARAAIDAYDRWQADRVIGEVNNGGDLIGNTLHTIRPTLPYKTVHASRGKAARAEPIAARYEQGRIHHVGQFHDLEDQLVTWDPLGGDRSPDRLDAVVWLFHELQVPGTGQVIRESKAQGNEWIDRGGRSSRPNPSRKASRWME